MARIQDLPSELISMIIRRELAARNPRRMNHIKRKSSLGQTCRSFREIAKPEIFRSITRWTATGSSGKSAFDALLLMQKYPHYFKKLKVQVLAARWERTNHCCHQSDDIYDQEGFERDEEHWASTAGPLLSLISGSPLAPEGKLQTLILELPTIERYVQGKWYGEEIWVICEETFDRLDELLRAAAASTTIRSLEIRNLPPYNSSVFDTDAWRGFMGRLESLTLSLLGEHKFQNPRGQWPSWYSAFTTAGIDKTFRNHLRSGTKICIDAPADLLEWSDAEGESD